MLKRAKVDKSKSSSNKTNKIDSKGFETVRHKDCLTPLERQITATKTLNRFDSLSDFELKLEDNLPKKIMVKEVDNDNILCLKNSKKKKEKTLKDTL